LEGGGTSWWKKEKPGERGENLQYLTRGGVQSCPDSTERSKKKREGLVDPEKGINEKKDE